MLPYHVKYGAAELAILSDQVSESLKNTEMPPPPDAQRQRFDLLRQLVYYGGRRVRIVQGMTAMAQAHAGRDVRQLRKLELLFNAARKERLLPAHFKYKAVGEAWRRAQRGDGETDRCTERQQQPRDERCGEEQQELQPHQQPAVGASRPEVAREGGQHCSGGDDDMGGGGDTGVPPWRSVDGWGDDGEDHMGEEHQQDTAGGAGEEGAHDGGEDNGGSGGGHTLQELLDDLGILDDEEEEGEGTDQSGGASGAGEGDDDDEKDGDEEEFTI